jgi:hypothetical protein
MTDPWTDRLSEYVDGELHSGEKEALEAHLAGCPDCRTTLDELQRIVQRAASLPDRPPAHDLWPAIREAIRPEHEIDVVPLQLPRARRRFSFSAPELAAAAAVLMLVSGGAVWLALRPSADPPASSAPVSAPAASAPMAGAGSDATRRSGQGAPVNVAAPATGPAVSANLISAVTANYDQSIRELESTLAATRGQLDPVTVAVIERNLRIIDAAIEDARAALARDPNDTFMYRYLGNTLMKKIDLLRRVTSLGRAQT